MAIHKQGIRAKATAADRSPGVEEHLLGAGVLALTLGVVLVQLAG